MNLPRKKREEASATITPTLGLIVACSALFVLTAAASDPQWWSTPGPNGSPPAIAPEYTTNDDSSVTTNYIPSPNGAVTEGQLKLFTARAVDELNAGLPGGSGAGNTLNTMVTGWSNAYVAGHFSSSNPNPTNYYAVNEAQLKYVGNLVWSQLVAAGYTNAVPSWLAVNPSFDSNLVAVAQVKSVFNFDVTYDSTGNGLPDWWQSHYFGSVGSVTAGQDMDGNGLTLLQDFQQGNNPTNYYSMFGGTVVPALAIMSGNNQAGTSGSFVPQPLTIQVTDSADGIPLPNAGVTFTVASGGGSVGASPDGGTAQTVNVSTDVNGEAQVYFLLPSNSPATSQIIASTGGQTITFTETTSQIVATPTVSPGPGSYAVQQNVTVTSATSNATIYYTTDGTTPIPGSSPLIASGYTVNITQSETLQAIAVASGYAASPAMSAPYQITGQILGGQTFNVFLKNDGTVWTAGANYGGELGNPSVPVDSTTSLATLPIPVINSVTGQPLANIIQVAAGIEHGLALDSCGHIWAWGENYSGQLGNGSMINAASAVEVTNAPNGTPLSNFKAIAAGEACSFAIDNNKHLWAWGDDSAGELGNGSTGDPVVNPVQVSGTSGSGAFTTVSAVSVGAYHCLALDTGGNVWAWGLNSSGQLGNNDNTGATQNKPIQVRYNGANLSGISSISAGAWFSLAIQQNSGTVLAWGDNKKDELGASLTANSSDLPVPVLNTMTGQALTGVAAVSAGLDHSLAFGSTNGSLWSWGDNSLGETGTSTPATNPSYASEATLVNGVASIISIGACNESSFAIDSTGRVWSWGSNNYGQLALPLPEETVSGPVELVPPYSGSAMGKITQISRDLALNSNGQVWWLGGPTWGQETPVQLAGFNGITITSVAAGGGHNLALDNQGNVYAWGTDLYGESGQAGYPSSSIAPTEILSGYSAIAAGNNFSVGIDNTQNRNVWVWGWLWTGTADDPPDPPVLSPVEVTDTNGNPLANITAITASYSDVVALRSDQTVWAWGWNADGQLGNGGYSGSANASQVMVSSSGQPLTGIIEISNGLALRYDGTVWFWGTLQGGATCLYATEVKLSNGAPLIAYSIAGDVNPLPAFDLVMATDGTVWILNPGPPSEPCIPVEASSPVGLSAAGVESPFIVGLKVDNSVMTWNTDDSSGTPQSQLGIGGIYQTATPTQIDGYNFTNTLPTISITAGSSEMAVGAPLAFQAATTGAAGIAKVDYYNELTEIGESTTAPFGFNWLPPTWGTFHITAIATDNNGVASAPSAPVTIQTPYESVVNGVSDGVPDWWELEYLGQVGINGNVLAPNGSGLTLLQCYQQKINPEQASPADPFGISLAATGPFQAPCSPLIIANVTHPSNTSIVSVSFYQTDSHGDNDVPLGQITQAPNQCQWVLSNLPQGNYSIKACAVERDNTTMALTYTDATTQFTVAPSNFYVRGPSTDPVYDSSIIAIDFEQGVEIDGLQTASTIPNYPTLYKSGQYPWFLCTSQTSNEPYEPWQHITSIASNGTPSYASFNAIPIISGTTAVGGAPPLVAFGDQAGTGTGSPLYTNQSYNFGVAAGGQLVFNPISITSISNASPSVYTVPSIAGLYVGQMIVISNATGNASVNGTFLISAINTTTVRGTTTYTLNLTDPLGNAINRLTGYTDGTAVINNADIKVEVYLASSFGSNATVAPIYTQGFTLPRPTSSNWSSFAQNNYMQDFPINTTVGVNAINFDTQVQYEAAAGGSSNSTWDQQVNYALYVTHRATSTASASSYPYYYRVSYMGVTAPDDIQPGSFGTTVASSASDSPMAVNSPPSGQTPAQVYNVDYTLDFDNQTSTTPVVTNQPQFNGTPLPAAYQGMSLAELIANSAQVQSTLDAPGSNGLSSWTTSVLTTLNNSPELRGHPVLDNFVASMNNDPMALANYVLNEINLSDAVGYSPSATQPNSSETIGIDYIINSVLDTHTPHNLTPGQLITISGAQGEPLNGTYLVRSTPSTTTLMLNTLAGTEVILSDGGGEYDGGGVIEPSPASNVVIASVNDSTGVLTTLTPHNLYAGELISISGATTTAETAFSALNNVFLVGSTPSSNTLTLTSVGTLNGAPITSFTGAYNQNSGVINTSDDSINPQGVRRDAMATFLEAEGSPTEQCALLVYLLRKAGCPCGYVFPNQDQMVMIDQQLSSMLRMQIQGAAGPSGTTTIPQLIPVNYPWVAAWLPINGTYQWVHIFPWLKNTVMQEGPDLWGYMPDGYQSGAQWLYHYAANDSTIRQLTTPSGTSTDDINVLFPLYVNNQLEGTSLSIDQLGMTWYNQQVYYTRWQDFPRPWQTSVVTDANLAQNLDYTQNSTVLAPALANIFDTVTVQVTSSGTGSSINTGPMRLCDLHDRRLLLYHQVSTTTPGDYNMILSLEPFISNNSGAPSNPYTFNTGNNPDPSSDGFLSQQVATIPLGTSDDALDYNITFNLHQQAQVIPKVNSLSQWNFFLGVHDSTTLSTDRPLRKGDMACLCLNYGQVSQQMEEFEAEKYWNYQQAAEQLISSSGAATPADPEHSEGQLLDIMGTCYYYKLSQLFQNVENWTKTNIVTSLSYGLSKLSPLRDSSDNLVLTNSGDSNSLVLCYPRVDMATTKTAWVGNGTILLNSGDTGVTATDSAENLIIGGGSADEHLVINEFFQQDAAISTMKLLDISQGWSPGAVPTHPGFFTGTGTNTYKQPLILTASNYAIMGETNSYLSDGTTLSLAQWCGEGIPGSIWEQIASAFSTAGSNASLAPLTTVYITPGPVTATAQGAPPVAGQSALQYTGVGALIVQNENNSALISGNMISSSSNGQITDDDGGYGGEIINPFEPDSDTVSNILNQILAATTDGAFTLTTNPGSIYTSSSGNTTPSSGYAPDSPALGDLGALGLGLLDGTIVDTSPQVNTLQDWLNVTFGNGVVVLPPIFGGDNSEYSQYTLQMESGGDIGDPDYYGQMQATGDAMWASLGQAVYDPVNIVTGEFYVNALDLKLNGPMPLEIRRTYGSFNQANNNFGYGWRMSYFPYLMFSGDAIYGSSSTNSDEVATQPSLIYAAETDGSVIAYHIQGSGSNLYWIPLPKDNLNLVNVFQGAMGGTANPFNNKITVSTTTTNGTTYSVYTLTGADGSVRTFMVQSFGATSGSSSVTMTRPYLQKWTDNRGNYYTFSYGNSTNYPSYGQLTQISSSNGDFVGFDYDVNGHIVEAFTGDGRFLYYQYDTFGDLIQVTRPDASTISYDYQHETVSATAGSAVASNGTYNTAHPAVIASDNNIQISGVSGVVGQACTLTTSGVNGLQNNEIVVISGAQGNTAINGTFTVENVIGNTFQLYAGKAPATVDSTHLIVQETKPNGRVLQNAYETDGTRRVATQSATVGPTQALVKNATFTYVSKTLEGSIAVDPGTYDGINRTTDVFGNETEYKYTANQITEIDYPTQNKPNQNELYNGPETTQTWYYATSGVGYQRSLQSSTDRRGLKTSNQYYSNGNLAGITVVGDLTGVSLTSTSSSTMTMTYDTTPVTLPGGGTAIPNTLATVTRQVDSSGDTVGTTYSYNNPAYPFAPTSIGTTANGSTVSTETRQYGNILGSSSAYGLLLQDTLAAGTPDQAVTQYTYNPSGFLTQAVQETGDDDPNVVINFTYDLRGELTLETDAAGQSTQCMYDALGHPTAVERYDQWGNLVSTNFTTYNLNGGVEWIQGPRSSPNDYIYKQYDGAGRLSQNVQWLSQAQSDGSGVTSSGYATTTYTHDNFGNLTGVADPNGNTTTMTYDADSEMLTRAVSSPGGTSPLSSESFTYEPGGKVATHTGMLGGTESIAYTSTGQVETDEQTDTSTNSTASSISYLYDYTGRVTQQTLSNASYWTISYDDVHRVVTRKHFNSGNTQPMQESRSYDRRGNLTSYTDVSGNTFTTTYDGLNRTKTWTGPGASGTTSQQSTLHIYGAAGQVETVANAAGERTTTYYDALRRPTLISVFNGNGGSNPGAPVSNTGFWYSPDHQSVVKTVGTGAANSASPAVTTTTYTDTRGKVVLLKHADGAYQTTAYDANGNETSFTDEMNAQTTWTYDGLNRALVTTLPGGATTTNSYAPNSPGETVKSAMSTGNNTAVTQQTTYDSLGRKTGEELLGTGNAVTRDYAYKYYSVNTSGGSIGKLQTIRLLGTGGYTSTFTYDAWARPTEIQAAGSGFQDQNTNYTYDNRGMVASVEQNFASSATGASTLVQRSYDGYGNINGETTYVDPTGVTTSAGSFTASQAISQWSQSWDQTGRRSALDWTPLSGQTLLGSGIGTQYTYQHNALGLLTQVTNAGVNYQYAYGDDGLLTQRTPTNSVPTTWGATAVTGRDSRGRITGDTVSFQGSPVFSETMSYRNDDRLGNYTCSAAGSVTGINNENRTYGYDTRGQLTSEPYTMSNSANTADLPNGQETAQYSYDQTTLPSSGANVQKGLGIRTFQSVNANTYDQAQLESSWGQVLTYGENEGTGTAVPWTLTYDGAGNVTKRSATGTSNQTLGWDAGNHLVQITDSVTSLNWKTVYDGFGRRIQTTTSPPEDGVSGAGNTSTVTYYYDPQVTYLELGQLDNNINNTAQARVWRVYGPDRSGVYGGAQGIGGLDNVVDEATGKAHQPLNNYFGDSLGFEQYITTSSVSDGASGYGIAWGSYGPEPGAEAASASGFIPGTAGWRDHYADYDTGLVYFGARYYDTYSGRFLSADPMGHTGSMDLYNYCNGDPVNGLDPDGNLGKGYLELGGDSDQDASESMNMLNPMNWEGAASDYTDYIGAKLSNGLVALEDNTLGKAMNQIGEGYSVATSSAYTPFERAVGVADMGGGFIQLAANFIPVDEAANATAQGLGSIGERFLGDAGDSMVPMLDNWENEGGALLPQAAEGGLGEWQTVNEAMSERAAAYQTQITGQPGQAYVVNGVKFDGISGNTLLDAKGPGYANFVDNGQFQPWFSGQQSLVSQAESQIGAAGGAPIQWHIAEEEALPAFQNLFQQNGISGIQHIHTPVVP